MFILDCFIKIYVFVALFIDKGHLWPPVWLT